MSLKILSHAHGSLITGFLTCMLWCTWTASKYTVSSGQSYLLVTRTGTSWRILPTEVYLDTNLINSMPAICTCRSLPLQTSQTIQVQNFSFKHSSCLPPSAQKAWATSICQPYNGLMWPFLLPHVGTHGQQQSEPYTPGHEMGHACINCWVHGCQPMILIDIGTGICICMTPCTCYSIIPLWTHCMLVFKHNSNGPWWNSPQQFLLP